MTSKIVVNNIEADAGVSTVTFGSEISASKITTSSTSEFSSGLNVTGTLTCDGITSDGDVTIRAATGNLYIKDTDNDGVVAVQRIVGRDSADNDEWILGQTSTSNSNITLGNVNNAEIIFRTNDTDRLQLSGDGSILYPTTTNAMDIGGSSNQFRNAYFDGTVNCDGLSCNGTATITANAGVLEIQDNNNDGVAAQQRINGIDSASNIDWYLGQTSNTNSDIHLNNVNNNAIVFSTNNTERMRITNAGYSKFSNNGTYRSATFSEHEFSQHTSNEWTLRLNNHHSSDPYGLLVEYTNASPNDGSHGFFYAIDSAGLKAQFTSKGGLQNYQAYDANLSDEREKKNIETLDSTWDCLKHWELKKFHYNEDDDTEDKKYGVIAQQVAPHCPEVITDWVKQQAADAVLDEDGNEVEPAKEEIVRMGVKEQQMYWMAIKALQEAQTRIETLETANASQSATIAALDARLTALEGN